MLIRAITLFRLRAVGDFLFAFSSLINIDEAPVTLRQNIDTHRIFSQLFSFTLRHELCLSEYSPSRPFLHISCVFNRLDAPESQSVLCLSVLERTAHTHTRAHTHARTHTHTHTHTRANTQTPFSLGNSVSCADCRLLSTFYYQTCPAI